MIIYVDLVFILNVFLDFILLMSVSVILNRNAKIKRMIFGSLLGGGSTFILFVSINQYYLFLLKFFLGLLMIIVTFGYRNMKYTYNNMFYLLTISFSISGVLYLFNDKKIYNYFILIITFVIVTFIYIKQIRKFQNNYANYYSVIIYLHGKKMNFNGFLDTGNKLYDNYHHRPVILVDEKIPFDLMDVIYVPYVSLNNESILKCLKADKIIINNHIFNNYLVGLSEKKFQIDGINCLLHSEMKGKI